MAGFAGRVKWVCLPTEPMKMLNMVCKINHFTHPTLARINKNFWNEVK